MKHWFTTNWLNLLAILILLGSFGDHPYSYYQTLRWVVCIAAIYSAYIFNNRERRGWMWIFIAMAILFNPVAPFYLNRSMWQIWDLVATVILFLAVILLGQKQLHRLDESKRIKQPE